MLVYTLLAVQRGGSNSIAKFQSIIKFIENFQVLQKLFQYCQSTEKSIAKFQIIAISIVIFCAVDFVFKLCYSLLNFDF